MLELFVAFAAVLAVIRGWDLFRHVIGGADE